MEDPVPVKEEYTYQVGKIQFIVTPVYKMCIRDRVLGDTDPGFPGAPLIVAGPGNM